MFAGCTLAGDFAGDPTEFVRPREAFIQYIIGKLTLTYDVDRGIPASNLYVYINNKIIDRNGFSGKSYTMTFTQLLNITTIAIVPVAGTINSTTYDPVCGNPIDRFENFIQQDMIPAEKFFVCPDVLQGHVTVEDKAKVFSITRGTIVSVPPALENHYVQTIEDYRFTTPYDCRKFQHRCSDLPQLADKPSLDTDHDIGTDQDTITNQIPTVVPQPKCLSPFPARPGVKRATLYGGRRFPLEKLKLVKTI